MRRHLTVMSNVISELRSAGHQLTGKQQVTDLAVTDHIARDRNAYVDFHRISKGSRSIYMGNNTSTDVLGIGTYKLIMRKGRTLYLHGVLYAPEVRRNLVSIVVLVKLGFKIVFEQDCVKVLLDNVVYGYGFLSYGFIVLDTIPINKSTSVFAIGNSSGNSVVNAIKWHVRQGHIGEDHLKRLAKTGLLGPIEKIDLPVCEKCLQERQKDCLLEKPREQLFL